jgi:hypothetical protein
MESQVAVVISRVCLLALAVRGERAAPAQGADKKVNRAKYLCAISSNMDHFGVFESPSPRPQSPPFPQPLWFYIY